MLARFVRWPSKAVEINDFPARRPWKAIVRFAAMEISSLAVTAFAGVTIKAGGNAVKDFFTRENAWVIRCSRSRETSGDARNDRILTNPATKILNGVGWGRVADQFVERRIVIFDAYERACANYDACS